MSEAKQMILDPASLAEYAALSFHHEQIAGQETPDSRVCRLDQVAGAFQFIDQNYLVESSRGFSIPVGGEQDEQVNMADYYGLNFEGTFFGYSKLIIDNLVNVESDDIYDSEPSEILVQADVQKIGALCLTFHQATILPSKEQFPDEHMLLVPVLSVNKIAQA